MTTIVKSPRRILEDALGIVSESHGMRTADWIGLRCGEHVYDACDARHVGVVQAVSSAVYVTVKWVESGWRSTLHISKLRKVDDPAWRGLGAVE